nr:hypothetical protein [Tanacetum cinerariifolium]
LAVITMSEYLRFLFLSGATIEKGTALTSQDQRVEVEDPKIVAIRERKAGAAAKKRERKKRGADEGEGSRPKVKRKKASIVQKDSSAASEYVSSLEPIQTVIPTGPKGENPSGTVAATVESHEDHSPPCDSANYSVHEDTDVCGDE